MQMLMVVPFGHPARPAKGTLPARAHEFLTCTGNQACSMDRVYIVPTAHMRLRDPCTDGPAPGFDTRE